MFGIRNSVKEGRTMSIVYINIGTPKTGTTVLQTFLRENEEELNKQGFCYPMLKLGIEPFYADRNGQFLVYESKTEENKAEREAEVRNMAYQQLQKYIEKYPNIILSDEQIWYRSRKCKHFWKDVQNRFREMGCDVKVIVYLRRQDLLVQSLWNQSIKMFRKNKLTFKECLEKNYFRYHPLNYYDNLKNIEKFLGKENIIVRPYEWDRFEGEEHSLFSDFFQSVGLTLTEGFHKTLGMNYGLEGNFIEIKRWINNMPGYAEIRDFLSRPVLNASMYYTKLEENENANMFSYEEQKAYLAQFEESNRKVAEEYLGRRGEPLFYDEVKEEPEWIFREDRLSRDIVAIMAEAFSAQERQIADVKSELKETKQELESIKNMLPLRAYRKVRNFIKQKEV